MTAKDIKAKDIKAKDINWNALASISNISIAISTLLLVAYSVIPSSKVSDAEVISISALSKVNELRIEIEQKSNELLNKNSELVEREEEVKEKHKEIKLLNAQANEQLKKISQYNDRINAQLVQIQSNKDRINRLTDKYRSQEGLVARYKKEIEQLSADYEGLVDYLGSTQQELVGAVNTVFKMSLLNNKYRLTDKSSIQRCYKYLNKMNWDVKETILPSISSATYLAYLSVVYPEIDIEQWTPQQRYVSWEMANEREVGRPANSQDGFPWPSADLGILSSDKLRAALTFGPYSLSYSQVLSQRLMEYPESSFDEIVEEEIANLYEFIVFVLDNKDVPSYRSAILFYLSNIELFVIDGDEWYGFTFSQWIEEVLRGQPPQVRRVVFDRLSPFLASLSSEPIAVELEKQWQVQDVYEKLFVQDRIVNAYNVLCSPIGLLDCMSPLPHDRPSHDGKALLNSIRK